MDKLPHAGADNGNRETQCLIERGNFKNPLRGQAAMEYMIMLGFAMLIILPIWLYANSTIGNTSEELDVARAKVAVGKIRDAANSVYVQGPPSQMYIDLDMPSNIQSTAVNGREVQILLYARTGQTDIYEVTLASLQGSLPNRPGRVRVLVKAETNFVNITE